LKAKLHTLTTGTRIILYPETSQVASVYLIKKRKYFLGAVMFCGALNHKQMTLYFAPVVFFHLLGLCLRQPGMGQKVSPMDIKYIIILRGKTCSSRESLMVFSLADNNVPLAGNCSYFVIFSHMGPIPVQYFIISASYQPDISIAKGSF